MAIWIILIFLECWNISSFLSCLAYTGIKLLPTLHWSANLANLISRIKEILIFTFSSSRINLTLIIELEMFDVKHLMRLYWRFCNHLLMLNSSTHCLIYLMGLFCGLRLRRTFLLDLSFEQRLEILQFLGWGWHLEHRFNVLNGIVISRFYRFLLR